MTTPTTHSRSSESSEPAFNTETGFSRVGHVLNDLLMKHNDDLGGAVQGAIYDADAAFSTLDRLRDWAARGDGFGSYLYRTQDENNGYSQAVDEVAKILGPSPSRRENRGGYVLPRVRQFGAAFWGLDR